MKISIKVRRQASSSGASSYQTYAVDVDPDRYTVLDVLNQIQWQQDGSLVFRRNCRNAICGSCAMRVNDRARLACQNLVSEVLESSNVGIDTSNIVTGNKNSATETAIALDPPSNPTDAIPTLLVEPMQNLPVIKDLVVDMAKFWQNLEQVDPYVSTSSRQIAQDQEFRQTPAQREKLQDAANCILCGSCYSDCNAAAVNEGFVGPHALAKAYRVMMDNRDDRTAARIAKYNEPDFVWGCTRCYNCNEVCPVGVQPLDRISQVKHKILRDRQLPETRPQRHRHVMVDLVKAEGWIDESKFGVRVVGNNFKDIKGLFSLVPLGLRMVFSGKMPWPWQFKPSPGTKQVRSLIEAVQKRESEQEMKP